MSPSRATSSASVGTGAGWSSWGATAPGSSGWRSPVRAVVASTARCSTSAPRRPATTAGTSSTESNQPSLSGRLSTGVGGPSGSESQAVAERDSTDAEHPAVLDDCSFRCPCSSAPSRPASQCSTVTCGSGAVASASLDASRASRSVHQSSSAGARGSNTRVWDDEPRRISGEAGRAVARSKPGTLVADARRVARESADSFGSGSRLWSATLASVTQAMLQVSRHTTWPSPRCWHVSRRAGPAGRSLARLDARGGGSMGISRTSWIISSERHEPTDPSPNPLRSYRLTLRVARVHEMQCGSVRQGDIPPHTEPCHRTQRPDDRIGRTPPRP